MKPGAEDGNGDSLNEIRLSAAVTRPLQRLFSWPKFSAGPAARILQSGPRRARRFHRPTFLPMTWPRMESDSW
jgi:hypothetical protein